MTIMSTIITVSCLSSSHISLTPSSLFYLSSLSLSLSLSLSSTLLHYISITDGLERLTEVMSLLDQSNRTLEQSNLFVLSAESITSSTYSGTQFSVLEDSGISLPPDLLTGRDFVDRLVFSYYYNSRLTSVLFESVSMTLVSSVLAASASGATLTNLSTPVNISFGMVSLCNLFYHNYIKN